MPSFTALFAVGSFLFTSVSGFGISSDVIQPRFGLSSSLSSRFQSTLYAIRCEEKYYQLEEMEDKDTSTTELFLTLDRKVEFGDTDGPIPVESIGNWDVVPDTNVFSMTIKRKFKSGADSTDMGEFSYDLIRTYTGEMTKVGDAVGITGVMHNMDETLGDEEIGYFNMIDATDERVGDDKKVP